jgi:hypothetical protein
MDKDIKKALWDELKILQTIIDKFDRFSFQIKNWFFTIFVAITGYAVVNDAMFLIWLSFGIIVIFYSYEITYRVSQGDFLKRSREIQEWLRENKKITKDNKPPNLDKYLFLNLKKVSNANRLYRLQIKIGIERKRAQKNVHDCLRFFKESFRFLFQFRVSMPYIAAVVINIIALILLYNRDP